MLNPNENYEKYPKIIKEILYEKEKTNFNKNLYSNEDILGKKNIYIAGDSHMRVLLREMKKDNKIVNNYNLIDQNLANGCFYVFNFSRVDLITNKKLNPCTLTDQRKRRNKFIKSNDSIVIIGGRLPLWLNVDNSINKFSRLYKKKNPTLSGWAFTNSENISLEDGVKNSIIDLLDNGVKVILVYPVPVLNFYPVKKIFDSYTHDTKNFYKNLKEKPFTEPYDKFLIYSKKSHRILDSLSHQNLYKIYTHNLFCEKETNLCKSHDEANIFYIDTNHLSPSGNKKVVNELIKILEQISIKTNK